jgi:hypothetical protein
MMRPTLALLAAVLLVAGCRDTTSPRDTTPPSAPRGVTSVTGDGVAYLHWLANPEGDVAGYRVYESPCLDGDGCPYDPVGMTEGTSFTVSGLTNGVTRYFAVGAVDRAGNESRLSKDDVFDTPRPEGFGRAISNYLSTPASSGYDFSSGLVRAWDNAATDIFYGHSVDGSGSVHAQIFVPDFQTDIQDAGYAASLDAVDYAPTVGWSPSGTVEAIPGHCYIVWTRDNHYAKLRVISTGSGQVVFDWAYQVDAGNRELQAKPVRPEGQSRRAIVWLPV